MLATLLRGRIRGAGPVVLASGSRSERASPSPCSGPGRRSSRSRSSAGRSGSPSRTCAPAVGACWLLPPLFLLWANLHAGFIAGIGFLAIVLVAEVIKQRWSLGSRGAAQADHRPRGRARCVRSSPPASTRTGRRCSSSRRPRARPSVQKGIIEWQSPNFSDPGGVGAAGAAADLCRAHGRDAGAQIVARSRFELRDFALAGAGAALALTSVRNTAICMAVMVPPWMAMAADLVASIEARRTPRRTLVRARPERP